MQCGPLEVPILRLNITHERGESLLCRQQGIRLALELLEDVF